MLKPLALFALTLAFGTAAQAQVYRCEDGKGKIIFADSPCPKNYSSELIEPKKSDEEIMRERSAAAQANERRLKQENMDLKRRELENSRQNRERQAAAPINLATTPACLQARKDMDWIPNVQSLSEEDKRVRMNAAITKVNASCGTRTELMQPPPQPVYAPYCHNGFCSNSSNNIRR